LAQYFAGQRQRFDLPLDLGQGSALQQLVWQALLEIAPGKPAATASWPAASDDRKRRARSVRPSGATACPSSCLVTGSSAATAP
jgi:methylated-DNA-[protein]-cysteine S-methyltransferase